MTKKDVQLNIRMTKDLKNKIEASAKANNRTTNAEAITLIEQSLPDQNAHEAIQPNDEKQPDIRDELREELKEYLEKELIKNKDKIEETIGRTIGYYFNDFINSVQKKETNGKK
ncbi:Arc family DNA-binding protein [Xenorhabdus bovienii]|uniref:Arc family DNA-binding protein n=1 Tax=Xenorhabdus bovienii TaxID=40576 RepID=UPI0023B3053F|nr:Arc family DNA-binding protein [Xenorhabdus bovienii]MDE9519731.1 Arc family DNA-binding protein [Xenorhabdus bovienii]